MTRNDAKKKILLALILALSPAPSMATVVRGIGVPGQAGLPVAPLETAAGQLGALGPEGLAPGAIPQALPDLASPTQLPAEVPALAVPAGAPSAAALPAATQIQANLAPRAEEGPRAPGELTLGPAKEGQDQPAVVQAVNDAVRTSEQAQKADGPGESLALAGSAMDGSRSGLRGGSVQADPVAVAEVFRPGIARPESGDRAAQLEGIARDVARLRAADTASLGEGDRAVLRGIDDLQRMIRIGRTTPAQLARDAAVLEAMPDAQVAALTELARTFLRPGTPAGPIAANWEHVNLQHLTPLERDAAELAGVFNRGGKVSDDQFAARLRLLMMVHDLGKVEMPADMSAALGKAFPDKDGLWFVNTAILPHEYGSMFFIEQLGRRLPAGLELSRRQTLALQRLIANHNFGPDLARAGNAGLRGHWWPGFFRRNMIPALAALGLPVQTLFNRDEAGNLQYNHAEGGIYPALLSAYDRALANKDTGYGVSAWYKFANQDHQGWVKAAQAARAAGRPIPQPVFNGPAVVARMEESARWTAEEIDSLWRTLYERGPAASGRPERYSTWEEFRNQAGQGALRGFEPYADQANGADKLNIVIRWVKSSNPKEDTGRMDIVPAPGTAYYTTLNDSPLGLGGTLFRVRLDYSGEVPSARVEQMLPGGWGAPRFDASVTPVSGENPVDLFFGLIKKDRIVKE